MKLLHIHIDNFGLLQDYDLSLNEGLNEICKENGSGKTTLGAFIKVMFFGFDNEGKAKEKRERLQYLPWQGGSYGGSISFEVDGKRYILKRTFFENKNDDTAVLRDFDTNLISDDFSLDKIGEEIFKIDGQSFARTMFISQKIYEMGNRDDIDAKIGNMVDNTDDINNYENALKAIDSQVNILNRRKTGTLSQINDQISFISNQLRFKPHLETQIAAISAQTEQKQNDLDQKKDDLNQLDEQIKLVSDLKDKLLLKERYQNINESFDQAERTYLSGQRFFGGKIPDDDRMEEVLSIAESLDVYKNSMRENHLNEDQDMEYEDLKKIFGDKTISENKFAQMNDLVREISSLERQIRELDLDEEEREELERDNRLFIPGFDLQENLRLSDNWKIKREDLIRRSSTLELSVNEKEKLQQYDDFFAPGFDPYANQQLEESLNKQKKEYKEELSHKYLSQSEQKRLDELTALFEDSYDPDLTLSHLNSLEEKDALEKEVLSLQTKEELVQKQIKKKRTWGWFLLGASVILLGAGVYLYLYQKEMMNFAIVSAAASLILLVISLFLIIKKQKDDYPEMIEDDLQKIEIIKDDVFNYLNNYHLDGIGSLALPSLHQLQRMFGDYQQIKEDKAVLQTQAQELQGQIDLIDLKAEDYLNAYGLYYGEDSASFAVRKIKEDYDDYVALKKKNDELQQQKQNDISSLKMIEEETSSYLDRYGYDYVPDEVLISLYDLKEKYERYCRLIEKRDSSNLKHLKEYYREDCLNADEFFREFGLDMLPQDYIPALGKLKEKYILYTHACEKKAKYEENKEKYTASKRELVSFIDLYQKEVQDDLLSQIYEFRDHLNEYRGILPVYEQRKQEKEAFEQEYPDHNSLLFVKEDKDIADISLLNGQRKDLSDNIKFIEEELRSLKDSLNQKQEEFNDLCEQEDSLILLKEQREKMSQRLDVLMGSHSYLEKAKASLNAKYLKPMKDSLQDYFSEFSPVSSLRVDIDANKDAIITASGQERNLSSLSKGYQDIVDLCLRLSLIDAMYPDEKPLVILDDPFANLDEEKIKGGLDLLNKISDRYQILYMTCHNSRI